MSHDDQDCDQRACGDQGQRQGSPWRRVPFVWSLTQGLTPMEETTPVTFPYLATYGQIVCVNDGMSCVYITEPRLFPSLGYLEAYIAQRHAEDTAVVVQSLEHSTEDEVRTDDPSLGEETGEAGESEMDPSWETD